MTRLFYLAGFLLVLGFAWSMIKTALALTAPMPEGELWRLNTE